MHRASDSFSSWWSRHADSCDAYIAAAVHGCVDEARQERLETILFASSRDRMRWAGASFAPPSILAALAQRGDAGLNRRLARHEHTPSAALECIRQVEPDVRVMTSLAAHLNASASLLRSLPHVGQVGRGLAGNPVCPSDLLEALLPSATMEERKLMAANPAASGRLLSILWEGGADDIYLAGEVVANGACPQALHAQALKHREPIVRRKLAANPTIRTEDLIALLADPVAEVRAEAARHAPAQAIEESEDDPARVVRRTTARRHDLPAALVAQLACDEDIWVRCWIARNPGVDAQTLHQLARDEDHAVRRGVARNPKCPRALLFALAGDEHPWVRAGVSFRTDLDSGVIALFEQEDDIDVLSGLGRNRLTPHAWLERIAASSNADLRRSVIQNPFAPPALLRQLAEDPYAFNRACLVKNPALPTDVLLEFLADPEPQLRFMSAARLVAENGLN
ncbi:hypothetical protein ACT6QH_05740 [Xanthobacter sp. TB0139]|uniref:hypothetical protein n=1 Tax=Xanthobacter sp. TB0139 TaxID=3459178 RepID=UPI00403A4941